MRHDTIRAESITVSATRFVRHFSELRRNAERGPVYIENHGKPGWALLSADLLDAMVQGPGDQGRANEAHHQLDALMDALVARVLLVDTDLRLVHANPAARRHFDIGDETLGSPLARILSPATAEQVMAAARRTLNSGTSEVLEADSTRYPGRAQRITTASVPRGISIIIEDLGDPGALRTVEQRLIALESAVRALPASGYGSVNMRGAIDRADPSLCALSGAAAAQLIGTRLGTLFDIATRAAVNELIERALDGGQADSVNANLLAKGEERRPVTIAIAPVGGRSLSSGATFVVIDRAIEGTT